MKLIRILILIAVLCYCGTVEVRAMEAEIYQKVDADALAEALPEETRELLFAAGISPKKSENGAVSVLVEKLSAYFREEITKPAGILLKLLTVVVFTGIIRELAPQELRRTTELCGTLCSALLMCPAVGELMEHTADAAHILGGFLVAAVPVYTGLIVLSGSAAAGSTYGALTLGAANGISALSVELFLPLLRVFLAITTVSAATACGLERLANKLYQCVKWALTLSVSVFTGILSLQTLLTAQADAVAGKAVKMITSGAIPIVGGAFGDALTVLSAGIGTVKSGVGAFGMLAALMILLPLCLKLCVWILACEITAFAAETVALQSIGSLMNGCVTVLKMLLALLFSTGAAAVIAAAVLLCVRGTYG